MVSVIPGRPEPAQRGSQRGLVTLLMLLILISTGSYFLLRALNQAAQGQAAAELTTQRALNAAREALLGYAARYPDNPENSQVSPLAGPGRLPCPDTRLNSGKPAGVADSPCATSSRTETGRLPWHTLDVPELLDGSGAPLWYAVSDNFRAGGDPPLNSETPGTLRLDGCAQDHDIVALVIAPGPALEGQARAPTSYDVAAYLEGDNASKGDNCFSRVLDEAHNDHVLAIAKQDLMAVVETRVLDDLANALSRYKNAHAAYPWLSPFSAPAINEYTGNVGTRSGLLPLRLAETGAADPYAIDGNVLAFDAPFTLRWSVPLAGTITTTGSAPPSERCLRSTLDSLCTSGTALGDSVPLQGDVSGIAGGEWDLGRCKALTGRKLSCRAVRLVVDPDSPARLRRTYTVVLTSWAYTIDAPTATSRRTQHFMHETGTLAAEPQPELAEIDLSDVLIADDTETALGSSRLILAAGNAVQQFELVDVPFDLEVDDDREIDPSDPTVDPDPDTDPATRRSPGELPYWLVANQWHHLHYVAYAAAHAPDNTATDCASHVDGCLTVNWSRTGSPAATLPVDGLVLSAGAAITRAPLTQTRPGSALADYFENANALDDSQFDQGEPAIGFNDRVRILEFDD